MLSHLRLRMTLLYTLAALALVALVGSGAYLVVARYFESVTDLALQHKMAHEFHALAAPIPIELEPADRDWSIVRGELGLLAGARTVTATEAGQIALAARGGGQVERVDMEDGDRYEVRLSDGTRVVVAAASGQVLAIRSGDDDDEGEEGPATATPVGGALTSAAYDAELAAIFVLPLDAGGAVLFNPNPYQVPLAADRGALASALANGRDLRTVQTADGRRVRLLTYRLTRSDGPAALQLGRVLSDQELVLSQLTGGMLALGALSVVLIGGASWWMAGRALRPAQEAWDRQQRFIASASHELRTPLTLIRASAEVALRGAGGDADQRELLGDVLAESDHMRRLVDDLLTLSRLDSGKLALQPERVALDAMLGEIQRQVARLGAERGVALALGATAGAVRADPDRLRQVLLILLDNALRHTPAGGRITIAAEPAAHGVRISVSDTGAGIEAEHLPHLFERFYRADLARGRAGGNAGLGLAIAQGLVAAHGGQIGVESAPGQGTCVWVSLPAG